MSDNNFDICSTAYFIFCTLFVVTGVWFPAAFMWVVWAFVGYIAIKVVLVVITLIMVAVMVHKASKEF